MKNIKLKVLAFIAAGCVLAAGVGTAFAYFTDSTKAEGLYQIHLAPSTIITEPEVAAGVKHLVITNTGESPVYVRATAFAGDNVTISYSGEGWSQDGNYMVYDTILNGAEEANELLVNFSYDLEPEIGDQYNVIVVYEATPVQYDENGNPYADWDLAAPVEGGVD